MRKLRIGWQVVTAAAFVLAAVASSSADESIAGGVGVEETVGSALVSSAGAAGQSGADGLIDTRLDYPASWRVAQAAPTPERSDQEVSDSAEGREDEPHRISASELSRQLSNPVTSLWSIQFQFNNYRLENGKWNNNLLFQPVLPVSLTKDLNLITRPVIPLYDSVPHETARGEFDRTTGFGDITLAEMLSPAHTGHWILGAGPSFIFPSASSDFTGQGKWQVGPAVVVGYLTKHFIVGVFPQQWWSFAGDSSRPDTSQMNLQPFASWFFGGGWKVGCSANNLDDLKASVGMTWTVPIGVEIGKVLKLGKLPLKIILAGQYMPVHPGNVGQEWNIQVSLTPVIPKLIKEPLFR